MFSRSVIVATTLVLCAVSVSLAMPAPLVGDITESLQARDPPTKEHKHLNPAMAVVAEAGSQKPPRDIQGNNPEARGLNAALAAVAQAGSQNPPSSRDMQGGILKARGLNAALAAVAKAGSQNNPSERRETIQIAPGMHQVTPEEVNGHDVGQIL